MNVLVDQVNNNVYNFLLGLFQGTTAVAVYSIAFQFKGYFQTLSFTIVSVFTSSVHTIIAENKTDTKMRLNELIIKVGRIQFIVLFLALTGFYFFGKQFIYFWVGSEYQISYYAALAIMAALTIQQALNKHKFRSIIYFMIAIVNVTISVPLAKMHGVIGCIFGTVIAIMFGNCLCMNIYYQKNRS